jgi:hypothetical protein
MMISFVICTLHIYLIGSDQIDNETGEACSKYEEINSY